MRKSKVKQLDTIIIGAGLSGLSCAVDLIEKGQKVLILERSNTLGGRASSWLSKGMEVESGLHRYLGFYTELPKLIKKVGANLNDIVMWEYAVTITTPEGDTATYFLAPFFRPLKTLTSFLGNNDFLNWKDKFSLLPFLIAGLTTYLINPSSLDRYTVQEYAKKFMVTDRTIKRLLVPLSAGIFFIPPDKYSAFILFTLAFFGVVRFLKLRFGGFKAGMSEVLIQPIAKYIVNNGGKIRMKKEVEDLIYRDGEVKGVKIKGKEIYAENVVVATAIGSAHKLLKKHFKKHAWFQDFFSLQYTKEINVQFELTKPALESDLVHFAPGTMLACFAEQSRLTFKKSDGRLSIILTPPDKFMKLKEKDLQKKVVEDLKKINIDIKNNIRAFYVMKQPDEFYSLTPGKEKLKPTQKTPIKGLTLAGDYTKQKLLSTMEGAVISGKKAAKAILSS